MNKELYLSYEVFIINWLENESYVYEVYDYIISTKRLYNDFRDNGIMLKKGWWLQSIMMEGRLSILFRKGKLLFNNIDLIND